MNGVAIARTDEKPRFPGELSILQCCDERSIRSKYSANLAIVNRLTFQPSASREGRKGHRGYMVKGGFGESKDGIEFAAGGCNSPTIVS